MNTFEALGLSENLLKVLEEMGFEKPTPIQQKAIPYLLQSERNDFIGLAQTGTGKTAAFGLPLIELVDGDSNQVQALILSPTRELGQQTAKQIQAFAQKYKKLNIEVVYGGAAITNQIKALKKPTQIVVATPGRLLDLIRRKAIMLDAVNRIVLDEADEMLNMGFKEEIDDILSNVHSDRSTWLFSATMPTAIRKITKKYMEKPFEVVIDAKQKTNKDIAHQYIVTKTQDKLAALRRFMDIQPDMRAIMFCRTKRETQELADQLTDMAYDVEALHGDLSQAQRDAAMKRFKAKDMQLLLATDVAARGIDVDNLTHVFHHKLPDQIEAYTHRSGRTARAGKKGLSIAFINANEGRRIKEIEQVLKISFEQVDVPKSDQLKQIRLQHTLDRLADEEIHPEAKALYAEIQSKLVLLSAEEISLKLISAELKKIQDDNSQDLNVSLGKGNAKGERTSKRDQRDENTTRFVINIGKKDGLNKNVFIDFVNEVSNVRSKSVSDISLQDNRTFFSIDKSDAKNFEDKFQGLELDNGHQIQVKVEDRGQSSGRQNNFRRPRGNQRDNRSRGKGRGKQRRGRR